MTITISVIPRALPAHRKYCGIPGLFARMAIAANPHNGTSLRKDPS